MVLRHACRRQYLFGQLINLFYRTKSNFRTHKVTTDKAGTGEFLQSIQYDYIYLNPCPDGFEIF